jgi:hypothetical protein
MNKDNVHGKSNSVNDVASEFNILSSIKQIVNSKNISTAVTSVQKLRIKPGTVLTKGRTNSGS